MRCVTLWSKRGFADLIKKSSSHKSEKSSARGLCPHTPHNERVELAGNYIKRRFRKKCTRVVSGRWADRGQVGQPGCKAAVQSGGSTMQHWPCTGSGTTRWDEGDEGSCWHVLAAWHQAARRHLHMGTLASLLSQRARQQMRPLRAGISRHQLLQTARACRTSSRRRPAAA